MESGAKMWKDNYFYSYLSSQSLDMSIESSSFMKRSTKKKKSTDHTSVLVWFQLSLTRSLDSMFCSIRTFCCWIGNQEVVGSNLQSDCFLHFCLNTDTTNNHTSVCNLLLLYHLHTWVDIISGRLSDVWNPNAFVSFRNLSCFSCLIIYFLSIGHSCPSHRARWLWFWTA